MLHTAYAQTLIHNGISIGAHFARADGVVHRLCGAPDPLKNFFVGLDAWPGGELLAANLVERWGVDQAPCFLNSTDDGLSVELGR